MAGKKEKPMTVVYELVPYTHEQLEAARRGYQSIIECIRGGKCAPLPDGSLRATDGRSCTCVQGDLIKPVLDSIGYKDTT